MPLIKRRSKKSFDENMETEMDEGKPKNQSLAIAYSMKKKAKKMAEGGMMGEQSDAHEEEMLHEPEDSLSEMSGAGVQGHQIHIHVNPKQGYGEHRGNYAHGGMAGEQSKEHEMDMVDRIMTKRACKGGMYSEGGKVADGEEELADTKPNEFDVMEDNDLAFSDTGESSGDEHGSKLNQEEDMVDRIMKKRKK